MTDMTVSFKVSNLHPDSKFDCETLKVILSEKDIESTIDELEGGWLIKVNSSGLEVIKNSEYYLCGKVDGESYHLRFEMNESEKFPVQHASLNESCLGNSKCRILVTNYPPTTTSGELENYFEHHPYGGVIQHIHFEQDHATITFFNPEVADNICSRSSIEFQGKLLRLYKDDEKPAKKNEEHSEKSEENAEKGVSQIATKTICVGNVPQEMDLEILEIFFENKKRGGGKIEEKPTRDPQTNVVEITFVDEQTAKNLVEKSPVIYNNCKLTISRKEPFIKDKDADDSKSILVYGVSENLTLDEIKSYFQNFQHPNDGEITTFHWDKKKEIKIIFASSDVANKVLGKQDHKIREHSLRVKMYISPKIDEKRLLISNIKHDVHPDTLRCFLDDDLNVDTIQKIRPGVWLINCNDIIDFEKVKKNLKKRTRKVISETYLKVKQVELANKIIVRNIPENSSVEFLENYFTDRLNPDRSGYLRMLYGSKCIVIFKDHNIASQWLQAKHDKFNCFLYYDYEDENTDEMFMNVTIFKLQFILNHKKVFEEKLKDCGYFIWSESHGDLLKIMFSKNVKEEEIREKVNELLKIIFEEELSIQPHIFSQLKETYHHDPNVYFDDKNYMVYIFSFDRNLATDIKQKFLSIVESKSKINHIIELSPHIISLLYADFFPSKIFQNYTMLKITRGDQNIMLTGSLSDISDVTREIHEQLLGILSTPCNLPRNASEMISKETVKEYLEKKLKKYNLICSWEINPKNDVIIYAFNNKNLIFPRNIFHGSFMELNYNSIGPIKKIMKGERWQDFSKSMSIKYDDLFHINEQKEKISIITTKWLSYNIGYDFQKFFDTDTIYRSILPLKPGCFEFMKTFCEKDIQRFCHDNIPIILQFRDDQMIHISAKADANKRALEFLKNLTKRIVEKSEEISDLGFKRFLKSDAADGWLRKLSNQYECIILKDEYHTNNIWKICSAVEYANSLIVVQKGDMTELEVDAVVNPANKQLKHIGGIARQLSDKGGEDIQKACDDIMAQINTENLQEGHVVVTTAGKLKNKIIIHAVAPMWQNGQRHEAEYLAETVTNLVEAAEQNNCSSIALPAIGTGINRFPIEKATGVIVTKIKDYLDQHPESGLKYIYLVSMEENVISVFQQQLRSIIPKDDPEPTEDLINGSISASPVSLFFYANSLQTIEKAKQGIIDQYKKDTGVTIEMQK